MHFVRPSVDSVFLLAATAAALVSAIAYGTAWERPRSRPSGATYSMPSYLASVPPSVTPENHEWKSLASGFDLFGPSKRSVVTERPPESAIAEPLAIELVAIRPEPFHLRLIGIVGHGSARRGVFEDISSGEIRLGRPGDTISQRSRIESIESRGTAVTARLRTLDADRSVELMAGSPAYTGERIATVRDVNGVRDVRAGERVANAAEKYVVGSITETSVTLCKESADESTVWRELHLPSAEEQP